MSRGSENLSVKAKTAFDLALAQANIIFEQQLATLGLGKSQIEKQGLADLERSLESIDDAIKNSESFGTVKLKTVGETGNFAIAKISSESNFEIGILPLLLERKKLILERISLFKRDEKIENLQDLIKGLPDKKVRTKLESELHSLETEANKLREQTDEVDETRAQEEIRAATELAIQQQVLFEKRTKFWRSFLEKESVATIIGALLLLIIAMTQIVAMFIKQPSTEIINNAFLLILGYFFGQSSSKQQKE
ncbi:MAG: hypothetical protein ABI904_05015 [Chloroflexota bacterium]